MIREVACVMACISATVYAQFMATRRFEVASIKASDPAQGTGHSGSHSNHGRVTMNNSTLKRCSMVAYGVGPNQIFGGPDWLDVDRFEITAKAEEPTNDDEVLMAMVQTLLAERFKLALHRETRMIQAYVLGVAKNGPKLEKAEAGESRTSTSSNGTVTTVEAQHVTMDGFAKVLARRMDLPVVNQAGLEGVFDIKLRWTPEDSKPPRPGEATVMEGPSIFTAIQEQLGLRLRGQKAPVEVLVIDHAERPTEN